MPKNIIVCLDGTNNLYSAANTNVVKLHARLRRDTPEQIAYYQPGIGTIPPPGIWSRIGRWVITRLDLAVAILLENHVSDAYRYLMRYYEPGDRIFVFGFSRGAYSARVLAAMIHKVGLLGKGNEEMISFAWDIFRRTDNKDEYLGFRDTFGRVVKIEFLGLWDTVSSVGWLWNPTTFPYTANNPCVKTVRHALAIDERRAYYVQNAWTDKPYKPDQDIKEVWFAGVHCDVGGGYDSAHSGLADITLAWMVNEARQAGVMFREEAVKAYRPKHSEKAVAVNAGNPPDMVHQSLRGWWWVAEWLPKRIRDPENEFKPTWIWPRGRPRTLRLPATIHRSVITRRDDPSKNYLPENLPSEYDIEEA